MNIKIEAITNGVEVINEFITPQLKSKGITINTSDEIKVFVHSEKAGKEVEVPADKVRFVFNR
jgi:hypothetical protein